MVKFTIEVEVEDTTKVIDLHIQLAEQLKAGKFTIVKRETI